MTLVVNSFFAVVGAVLAAAIREDGDAVAVIVMRAVLSEYADVLRCVVAGSDVVSAAN